MTNNAPIPNKVTVVRLHSSGGVNDVHDYEMSDGSIRTLSVAEVRKMISKKYWVFDGDRVYTRQTDRVYTHIVVADQLHHEDGTVTSAGKCLHWCGRQDLAEKAAQKARNDRYVIDGKMVRGRWTSIYGAPMYANVVVLPVWQP